MGDPRAEHAQAADAPTRTTLTGAEAIARSERILVGDAVTRDPAAAEGMALAGVRAASVGLRAASSPPGTFAPGMASCVHHVTAAPGHANGGSFELAATSAQEAVDDCLAAHLLSQRLGRPGVCSLTPKLADDLAVVQLPMPGEGAARLADAALSRETSRDPDRIAELAREVLEELGIGSGRPATPIVTEGDPDAELVLVAAGDEAEPARAAVRALGKAGVPARAAIVRLVRPFPTALARKILAGARLAVVVRAPGDALHGLLAAVRAALCEGAEARGVAATGPTELIEALREILPECGFDFVVSQLAVPEDLPLAHRLVIVPDAAWGEETARSALALLATQGTLHVGRRARRHHGAAVFAWSGGGVADGARDLMIASHPRAIEGEGVALLHPQSAVVVPSDGRSSEALLSDLSTHTRSLLLEREHRLYWVSPIEDEGPPVPGEADRAVSRALAIAAVAVMAHPEALDDLTMQRSGVTLRSVGAAELTAAPPPQEVDVRATSQPPRMPEVTGHPEAREAWTRQLRRFHLAGAASDERAPFRTLRPAVFTSLANEVRHDTMHPFVLVPDADATPPITARGLRDVFAEALTAAGRETGTLGNNLTPLAAGAARALARGSVGRPLEGLLAEAGDELVSELAIADEPATDLLEDLAALRASLPEGGRVFDLRHDTPLHLYLEVLAATRAPLEQRFTDELTQLHEALLDELQLDRMSSDEGHSSAALASEFGGAASRLLDPDTLAQTLPKDPSRVTLDDRHRERLTEALEIIEQHLGRADPIPRAVFLRPPDVEVLVPGGPPIEHPDPLSAAVGMFDGVAQSMAALFRAVRFARLEVTQSYRPELHDEMLVGLDWEGFTSDELLLMPAITVVTTGRLLRRGGNDSLSGLLRSSRPVHVIIRDDVAAADEAEDISLHHLDLGQLVIAHREAFAVGSTLARPQLLVERLARMFREPRPGVVLVPLPAAESTSQRLVLAEAALWGRACPDFLYDPGAGPSWADRFDVAGNPQPESAWPVHQITYWGEDAEQTLETAFTFADAVALEPAYLHHLRVIPRVAWHDETQLPLADFIAHFDPEHGTRGVPFLWVVDDAGFLQRAVVSRELTLACHDRLRSWHVLQEFGGFENAYAERAVAAALETARAVGASERAELEQAHADALTSARRDGAREAIQRLVTRLLNPDAVATAVSAATSARAAAPAAMTPPAEATAAAAPGALETTVEERNEEPHAGAAAFEAPYVDTALCTSCNECTTINSRLFAYDDNKQAFIADATAGSFAELVKAATLCPAKCIHPGTPRSGDASATPSVIAQAAEFN